MNVNPYLWYGIRELSIVPKHFVSSSTLATDQSKDWLDKNCNGRYAFGEAKPKMYDSTTPFAPLIFWLKDTVYFEDTRDLVYYELIWSGS